MSKYDLITPKQFELLLFPFYSPLFLHAHCSLHFSECIAWLAIGLEHSAQCTFFLDEEQRKYLIWKNATIFTPALIAIANSHFTLCNCSTLCTIWGAKSKWLSLLAHFWTYCFPSRSEISPRWHQIGRVLTFLHFDCKCVSGTTYLSFLSKCHKVRV